MKGCHSWPRGPWRSHKSCDLYGYAVNLFYMIIYSILNIILLMHKSYVQYFSIYCTHGFMVTLFHKQIISLHFCQFAVINVFAIWHRLGQSEYNNMDYGCYEHFLWYTVVSVKDKSDTNLVLMNHMTIIFGIWL